MQTFDLQGANAATYPFNHFLQKPKKVVLPKISQYDMPGSLSASLINFRARSNDNFTIRLCEDMKTKATAINTLLKGDNVPSYMKVEPKVFTTTKTKKSFSIA